MNKDEAIQLLERLQDPEPYEPMLTKDAYDAIQMAIDALSADGDTISRKAAIATAVTAAINWHKLANPQYSIAYCIGEAMRQLPPAQPEPHWIPVTEATPTEDDDYWATFETETGRFVDWASWYQGRWVVWIEDSPAPLSNVIAWMPLPEPYKGVTG